MILGPFRSFSISKSAYVNTCFFSTDNQSPREQIKFQMFTPFSGRHIGVPQIHQYGVSYWALQISAKHFDD